MNNINKKIVIPILLLVMPILGMAVDLISPALPVIAKEINVDMVYVKNMIAIYLVTYAVGNFISGFLTDAYGRRNLLIGSMILFILASLLPIFKQDIYTILLARSLQGITIGSISVITRAIFSDILSIDELVKMGTIMGSVFGLGPLIGPMIGSYLTFYFGYLACFIFFAISIGLIMLLIIFLVPESHFNLQPLNINVIKVNLCKIFRNSEFISIVIIMGLVYSLMISFHTIAPFIIQVFYHKSEIFYGHITLFIGLSFVVSTFLCRILLKHYSVYSLIMRFLLNALFFVVISILISIFYHINIELIIISSAIMFFSCGSVFPMSMGKGISLFRDIAGTATAVMYLINVSITAIVSFILSTINITNPLILFINYFVLVLFAINICWKFLLNKK